MNLSVVILVLLPMLLHVAYGADSAHKSPVVREIFSGFAEMKDKTAQLKRGQLELEDETNKLKKRSTNVVAFSVALSSSTTVQAGSNVLFDTIFVDTHKAYKTGIFTAPTKGLYEFNVHGLAQYNGKLFLDLYHGYSYVVSLYGIINSGYGSAGNAVILQVNAGDVVYVKSRLGYNSALYGQDSERYCTFSGHLIAAL